MLDMFSLTGQRALVTGARSGIGQAIAVGLAEAGADLVLLGRESTMDETVAAVRAVGRDADTFGADLGDPAAVADVARRILDRHQIDILVNNAGVILRGRAERFAFAEWRTVSSVNLDAVFLLSQACGAEMLQRGAGKVITVASVLSFQGGLNVSAYAATKHAVTGLTKSLANEWASRGVQVNALAPGYVETNNTRPLIEDEQRYASIRDRIPAGRWASPRDMVGAAIFLASRASDYVNGHVLVVDGGWMAR
ncbi:SDR family oxidoreductase [Fodinicola acaciae]|uniref:SDR family oxidoreductase n=1 Tax=Fodinicola acaciae TaxID=2681555 RepID=UPI0013D44F42|nr:SDR family oxidoreductase [Fodinicola acaciae]